MPTVDTAEDAPSNASALRSRNMPLAAKLLLVLTTSFSGQNFLGQPWLPSLLRLVPEAYRKEAALRILGMSPHYFIYQWTSKYPSEMSRLEILEAEHERNMRSRQRLFEAALRPHVTSDMTVLDFGCGPGYLASETAPHVRQVIAVDISPGAIACARVLNNRDNIDYVQNAEQSISAVADASVDLIYSFAVVQHMRDEAVESIAREWFRVLKPGGTLLCHAALQPESSPTSDGSSTPRQNGLDLRRRYALRMRYRTEEQLRTLLYRHGFSDFELSFLDGLDAHEDDIARDPLIICSKP